ncbi:MAG: TIGR04438 family Trp-rich protein [Burkholderiales bacterium]
MAFVVIGVLLVLLRWAEVGPTGALSWWLVLLPFALAVAWWAWRDATGMTQRHEMDKLDQKRAARRAQAMEALGRPDLRKKKRR